MTADAFTQLIEHWHDFYLLAGTAAATLAGLLFIAMALHIETLVLPQFQALIVVGRSTLASFLAVLIVSLLLLTPHATVPFVGVNLIVFPIVFSLLNAPDLRVAFTHHHVDFTRRQLRRRLLMPIVANLAMSAIGLAVLRQAYDALPLMFSVMAILLGNAVWASWDLLVRVGRAKDRMKADERAQQLAPGRGPGSVAASAEGGNR